MNEAEVEAFRIRYRLGRLERLSVMATLVALVGSGAAYPDAQKVLMSWLELDSQSADLSLGAHFKEPAQVAVYSDEVRAMTDKMGKLVDELSAAAISGSG